MSRTNGKIQFPDRARQLISFENMEFPGRSGWATITPSDVDGLMEYHDKLYILIEIKYGDTEFNGGQKIALRTLVRDLRKPAVLFVARHNVADTMQIVDAASCLVSECYYKLSANGLVKHIVLSEPRMLVDMVQSFIDMLDKEQAA